MVRMLVTRAVVSVFWLCSCVPGHRHPNIVLIVADDIGGSGLSLIKILLHGARIAHLFANGRLDFELVSHNQLYHAIH